MFNLIVRKIMQLYIMSADGTIQTIFLYTVIINGRRDDCAFVIM